MMGTQRRPDRSLSAAFALFIFFATAMGSGLGGITQEKEEHGLRSTRWVSAAASLNGPGSSPPTCRWRCGRCAPCQPVHVAIQPGRSVPLEYYPEAWRCKCANKLFMP